MSSLIWIPAQSKLKMAEEFKGWQKHFNSHTKQGRFGAAVSTLGLVSVAVIYKKLTGGGAAKVKNQWVNYIIINDALTFDLPRKLTIWFAFIVQYKIKHGELVLVFSIVFLGRFLVPLKIVKIEYFKGLTVLYYCLFLRFWLFLFFCSRLKLHADSGVVSIIYSSHSLLAIL